MSLKLIAPALLFLLSSAAQSIPKFQGRKVTIDKPELEPPLLDPKRPASVCIEAPPQRQCYTAPDDFGRWPTATLIHVTSDATALLFSAASGGVSGYDTHFALLRPGTGNDLANLLDPELSLSNQGQSAFWTEPSISDAKIFITADAVPGPDEAHWDDHRYIISAYVRNYSYNLQHFHYDLEDRYMTTRFYDPSAESSKVLDAEKSEVLARLKRVKQSRH
jgi:hypothetical protein